VKRSMSVPAAPPVPTAQTSDALAIDTLNNKLEVCGNGTGTIDQPFPPQFMARGSEPSLPTAHTWPEGEAVAPNKSKV